MNKKIKMLLRTAQTNFPSLIDAKYSLQRFYRNTLGIPFERDFAALKVFPDSIGSLYLDVGANRGQSIDAIRMMKSHSRIKSFEPNALLFDKLAEEFGVSDNVELYNFGLGNAAGFFTLYVPYYRNYMFDGLASFIEREASEWLEERIVGFDRKHLDVREVKCEVKTLDELELDPFFMKLDVQGYELPALEGAKNTLDNSRPVLLIESPGSDINEYLACFGYEQYVFQGGRLVRDGVPSPNAFFLTKKIFNDLN